MRARCIGQIDEVCLFAAVVYFVTCFALSWSIKRLQVRIAIVR
jgi:glutamate/aspartate transport system permease protein